MSLIHLENENFNEITNDGIVVVDFFANWCGPCKILSPTIEKLSNEINDIKFVKVDVDKHDDIARTYGIMSIPTLIVFKNGEAVDQSVGVVPEADIKALVEKAL